MKKAKAVAIMVVFSLVLIGAIAFTASDIAVAYGSLNWNFPWN